MGLGNVVKRKTHKERAQPKGRKKLGLLEKHKDYRLRANDFQRKRDHINRLERKAELRNTDEFYFGMNSSKTERGVHKLVRQGRFAAGEPQALSLDLARKLDRNYLETKLAHETNQLHRLEANLHFVGVDQSQLPVQRQRTKFVYSDDEEEEEEDGEEEEVLPTSDKSEKAYAELMRRKERVDLLQNAVKHVELKRNMAKPGKRALVAPAEGNRPAQYKWSKVRQR